MGARLGTHQAPEPAFGKSMVRLDYPFLTGPSTSHEQSACEALSVHSAIFSEFQGDQAFSANLPLFNDIIIFFNTACRDRPGGTVSSCLPAAPGAPARGGIATTSHITWPTF